MKISTLFKRSVLGLLACGAAGLATSLLAQAPPPLPGEAPILELPPPPPKPGSVSTAPTPLRPLPVRPKVVTRPTAPLARPLPAPVPRPQPVKVTQPVTALKWDAEMKEQRPEVGVMSAPFTFWVTNVYKEDVVISAVRASCGCTKPVLPERPWTLSPGESGKIDVAMNLSGKAGTLTKYLTVLSTAGQKILYVKAHIPKQAAPASQMERLQRMQLAMSNKQAVFSGSCVECHVTPGIGKHGKELYAASCGICHDAEHRAAMVPDLAVLKKKTDAAYWRQWITNGQGSDGRPSALMPAFGKAHKGPLTDEQIESLVRYLVGWKQSGREAVGRKKGNLEDVSFLNLPEAK